VRARYRENGKVKNRTLANLSHLPPHVIEGVRQSLKGGTIGRPLAECRPHGHVVAVLGTMRHLKMDRLLSLAPSHQRNLALALIAARILHARAFLTCPSSDDTNRHQAKTKPWCRSVLFCP
jgi:hypothetical protein